MRRFFIPPHTVVGETVTITGDLFRHMATVLRLKKGARVILAAGDSREYVGTVSELAREHLTVTIDETRSPSAAEAGPRITLFQGLPRGEKLELILQKCTELGAAEIIPFGAARSVARLQEGRLSDKLERWQRIAREAARQSLRPAVPRVSFARDLAEVVSQSDHSVKLLLWEGEEAGTLRRLLAELPAPESIAVIVGPEGGLAPEEVALATRGGFVPVSLGKRIIRTETAGLAILAILQFCWGDIG